MRYVKLSLLVLLGALFFATQPIAAEIEAGATRNDAPSGPDEATTNEPLPDPLDSRLAQIERDYRESLLVSLAASADPRDWAVAAMMQPFNQAQTVRTQRESLFERAQMAAPEDSTVQWMVLRASSPKSIGGISERSAALAALQRLEPDNAAVWMEDLAATEVRNDPVAVDALLEKMAASQRNDEHVADFIKLQIAVGKRYPMPDEYVADLTAKYPQFSAQAAQYLSVMAITAAIALPAYQTIRNACKSQTAAAEKANRAANCAIIGRLMLTKGTNLVANRMGAALLRSTGTFTDNDIRLAREQDWIYQQDVALLQGSDPVPAPDQLIARMDDWQHTGSELESMRREVERAGESTSPPSDWAGDRSPLSPERIRQYQLNLLAADAKAIVR